METTTILDVNTTSTLDCGVTENYTEPAWCNTTSVPEINDVFISNVMYISFAMSGFLVTLGLFGNTMTIIIMQKGQFKVTRHAVCLTMLAIADATSLITVTVIKESTTYVIGTDITTVTNMACKTILFFLDVGKLSSSAVVVLICLERFLAVWFPLKINIFLTKRRTVITHVCIFTTAIVVSCLGIPFNTVHQGMCPGGTALYQQAFLSKVYKIVLSFFHGIGPTVFLMILTPLTVLKLCLQRSKRQMLASQSRDNTTRISAMLFSIVISYIVLVTIPPFVNLVILSTRRDIGKQDFWLTMFTEGIIIFKQINYSINFCLYGLASYSFRKQFLLQLGVHIE